MNLNAMKDLSQVDPIGGLGEKLPQAPAPKPEPKHEPERGNPRIVQKPDGMLETKIPGNEAARFVKNWVVQGNYIEQEMRYLAALSNQFCGIPAYHEPTKMREVLEDQYWADRAEQRRRQLEESMRLTRVQILDNINTELSEHVISWYNSTRKPV